MKRHLFWDSKKLGYSVQPSKERGKRSTDAWAWMAINNVSVVEDVKYEQFYTYNSQGNDPCHHC